MRKTLLIFCLFISFGNAISYAQPSIKDWEDASKPDTVRLKGLMAHVREIYDLDSALALIDAAASLAEQKKLLKWQGIVEFYRGRVFTQHRLYNPAIKALIAAEDIAKQANNQHGLAHAILTRGNVLREKGNHQQALMLYLSAIEYFQNQQDSSGISLVHFNMGNLYHLTDQPLEALKHYEISKEIDSLIGDMESYVGDLSNIGGAYHLMKNYVKARSYYNRASALHLELENYRGYSNVLNNLGLLSTDEGDDVTALGWYEKAMEYFLMVQNMEGVADTWRNKGAAYFNLGNFQKAQEACEKALAISEELEISESTLQACDCLREVFQTTGDFRKAFEFQKRYYDLRDQLKGDENVMELTTMQLEHQFGQQMLADSLLAAQRESQLRLDQEILEKEKQQKQRETVLISIGGGIIIFSMALLLVNIQRSNQRKKKDNLLIKKQKEEVERQKEVAEHQRELVEEKNKEILDSINYARRLQDAILPPQKLVKEYLPNSFILYKPKDIVAGDFYWMETVDDTIYFAAADCTGHGVPGAMVSVVCSNALTKAVMEDGLREPGEILDRTRELVIKRFSKSEEGVRDGMDISLVALPSRPPTVGSCHGMTLRWAGANNPLWIIRKNVDDMAQVDGVTELVEVKADKQPIGNYEDAKPFTTHQIALYPGDSLYIFSDGFHDQFGGEKGKKYKSANLKQFLLQICAKPHSEQRQLLIEEFDRWKGEIEQIDDVCIIGLAV